MYSEDETVRENMLHTIRKQGVLLTPDRNTQKMAFLIRSIFSEMENREYMYRDMVNHFLMTLVVEIIRKLQNTELPDRVPMTIDIFPAIEYIKRNFIRRQLLVNSLETDDIYNIRVAYDHSAQVWIAYSEDIPGLAIESPHLEKLMLRLGTTIPELIAMNEGQEFPEQDLHE